MQKLRLWFLPIPIAVLVSTGWLLAGPSSATGSAVIRLDGQVRTFAFHAFEGFDGKTRGSMELHNRTTGVRLHGRIDCIRVDGNVATLSGVHEKSDDASLDGKPFWFRVVDYGEGSKNQPDEITLVATFSGGSGPTCQEDYASLVLIPIEGGNIQVQK